MRYSMLVTSSVLAAVALGVVFLPRSAPTPTRRLVAPASAGPATPYDGQTLAFRMVINQPKKPRWYFNGTYHIGTGGLVDQERVTITTRAGTLVAAYWSPDATRWYSEWAPGQPVTVRRAPDHGLLINDPQMLLPVRYNPILRGVSLRHPGGMHYQVRNGRIVAMSIGAWRATVISVHAIAKQPGNLFSGAGLGPVGGRM